MPPHNQITTKTGPKVVVETSPSICSQRNSQPYYGILKGSWYSQQPINTAFFCWGTVALGYGSFGLYQKKWVGHIYPIDIPFNTQPSRRVLTQRHGRGTQLRCRLCGWQQRHHTKVALCSGLFGNCSLRSWLYLRVFQTPPE